MHVRFLLFLLTTTTALPGWAAPEVQGNAGSGSPQVIDPRREPTAPGATPAWPALPGQRVAPGTVQPVDPAKGTPARDDAEAEASREILFEADQLDYDVDAEVVTATGNVVLVREGDRVSADQIVYNRKTGFVEARGNVRLVDAEGNVVTGERVELTDTLRQGVVDNILMVLTDGSRLAASRGTRQESRADLNRVVYSPCDLCSEGSVRERPLWRIKALRVEYDEVKKRLTYRHATFEFLNVPLLYLPYMSHSTPDVTKASGLLMPDISQSRALGLSLATPYLWSISPSRDLTVTPTLYTEENPTLGLEYRQHVGSGTIRVGGVGTYASRDFDEKDAVTQVNRGNDFRGYFYANGRLQHTARWRSSFDTMVASDDTFLRRYDITDDDVLRNSYRLEYFGDRDYLTLETWAFQGLRLTDRFGEMPIALPYVDYRWTSAVDPALGQFGIRANALSLVRTKAMDTYRVSTTADWQKQWMLPGGQITRLIGLVRGDAYYVNDADDPDNAAYAGRNGWHGRVLPLAAAEFSWPLAGPSFGGFQTLTPIVQVVAAGPGRNRVVPNEDSRAFDLEDTNLFDLNRFSGIDRWESGTRATYGVSWSWTGRNVTITADAGQSYRLSEEDSNNLFPKGSGLSGRFSDFVGRTSVRWGNFVDVVYRFRLDKASLTPRRSELDAFIGTQKTYLTVGYANLNRDILLEDLEDREELRVGGRVQVNRYWSLNAATILDLTSKSQSSRSDADGFQPIRHSVGVAYEDECFRFSVTWRRRFTEDRDFQRGSTIFFRFALRNLGGG
ncbi:LPS-assembly protein LptD [Pedomonas sp. V897]|uniref:LPS-assembly protein LptD n=1 Tax=Pedomonas sp. V897 TaxID=3446482 RepID=UPI003EDEF424